MARSPASRLANEASEFEAATGYLATTLQILRSSDFVRRGALLLSVRRAWLAR
jgi:hypothetical protein